MSSAELSNLAVSKVVDTRGSACPGPLLEAKKGINQVKAGDIL
jgi:tRNA 2-thiouridine synthesizing protein A